MVYAPLLFLLHEGEEGERGGGKRREGRREEERTEGREERIWDRREGGRKREQ